MKVRIVMPVYNRAQLLSEAVRSVVEQEHRDWELIIVDDGSTDGSGAIADKWAASDPRVTVVRQANGGAAAARNRGLDHPGDCDLVAFLDSDDIWNPGHLKEAVVRFRKFANLGLHFTRFNTTDGDGLAKRVDGGEREMRFRNAMELAGTRFGNGKVLLDPDQVLSALIMRQVCPATPTVVVRSQVLSGVRFDEKQAVLEDVLMWIHLCSRGCAFGYLDEPMVTVRVVGAGLTRPLSLDDPQCARRQLAVHRFNRVKLQFCRTSSQKDSVKEQLAASSYLLGQCYSESGENVKAATAYVECLWHGGRWRAWKALLGLGVPRSVRPRIRRIVERLRPTSRTVRLNRG